MRQTNHDGVGTAPCIEIAGVSHRYGQKEVLSGVTFEIKRNSLVAILGPSGCGKTTLLRSIAGLVVPTAGEILLDGEPPAEVRRRGKIGFAFQDPILLPWRSVLGNVLLPLEIQKNGDHNGRSKRIAQELIDQVQLTGEENSFPYELSGGMQQRVALARSLVTRPPYLLLDEPFGALDPITRETLNVHLRSLWNLKPFTGVLVTHSIEEAVFLADQIVVLEGSPARIAEAVDIELGPGRDLSTLASDSFIALTQRVREVTRRP